MKDRAMAVTWGVVVQSAAQVEKAAAAGFDCVQPAADFVPALQGRLVLPCTSSIVPLPSDVRVTERGFNLYAWLEHLKKALERLSALGCKKLIWNDGRARLLPLEGDQTAAREQAMQFLYVLCQAAAERGISVLVEPLGSRRTNFLNSLDEIRGVLSKVGQDNLGAAVSLRELESIGLSPEAVGEAVGLIQHVHMENPLASERARVSPRPGDGYDYGPFLKALRAAGYTGVICLPENTDASALAYCRELLA